jgi:hypothetical protein
MDIYVYTCISMYKYIYVYICMYICIHVYICIYVCICIYIGSESKVTEFIYVIPKP